jgi:hypothetical protein
MKAYKKFDGEKAQAAFTIDNANFQLAELTPEEEKTVLDGDLHNCYYVLYEWEFECHADNDGGIDAFQFGEKEIALSPEDSILSDGKVVGFYTHRRVFPLKENAYALSGGGNEYVGGWGDISSDSSYTLKKRK